MLGLCVNTRNFGLKFNPMTTNDKIKLIGKRGMLGNSAVYPLKFEVEITDVREHFGRVDYFVKPVGGTGERWVSADTVTVNK